MPYNKQALEDGILKCKKNIQVFEDAIEKERQTIKDYRDMMDTMDEQARVQKEIANNVHIEIVRDDKE